MEALKKHGHTNTTTRRPPGPHVQVHACMHACTHTNIAQARTSAQRSAHRNVQANECTAHAHVCSHHALLLFPFLPKPLPPLQLRALRIPLAQLLPHSPRRTRLRGASHRRALHALPLVEALPLAQLLTTALRRVLACAGRLGGLAAPLHRSLAAQMGGGAGEGERGQRAAAATVAATSTLVVRCGVYFYRAEPALLLLRAGPPGLGDNIPAHVSRRWGRPLVRAQHAARWCAGRSPGLGRNSNPQGGESLTVRVSWSPTCWPGEQCMHACRGEARAPQPWFLHPVDACTGFECVARAR